MPGVLPHAPEVAFGPSGDVEGLRHPLGETGDQRRHHQPHEEHIRVSVEGAGARHGPLRIEPERGRAVEGVEEVPYHLRRFPQNLNVAVHPGLDQALALVLGKLGHGLDSGIGQRVTDHRVLDVGVGEHRIHVAGFLVSRKVERGRARGEHVV